MTLLSGSAAGVRALGSRNGSREVDLVVDFSTSSTFTPMLSVLWVPGVHYFERGYIEAYFLVSARVPTNSLGVIGITIGVGAYGRASLGGATSSRAASAAWAARSALYDPALSGSIEVVGQVGRLDAPDPATFDCFASSESLTDNAKLITYFVRESDSAKV